jgi:hypothetical protein
MWNICTLIELGVGLVVATDYIVVYDELGGHRRQGSAFGLFGHFGSVCSVFENFRF